MKLIVEFDEPEKKPDLPPRREDIHPSYLNKTLEDRVEAAIADIESDDPNVDTDWDLLRRVYYSLRKTKELSLTQARMAKRIEGVADRQGRAAYILN